MRTLEELEAAATKVYEQLQQGINVPVDPELAEFMGAFADDSISLEDALEGNMFVDENGRFTGYDH